MRHFSFLSKLLLLAVITVIATTARAQKMQYFRPNDKTGLNIFETTKADTVSFNKLHVKVGGNFTQDFQMLKNKNAATPNIQNGVNVNDVMKLSNAFNLAMANLIIDAQLADGVRMSLTTYLSSRHHQEAWVQGGYIQFDKLSFLKSPVLDKIMEKVTIKIGDFMPDYGDAHYRRTDGGNTIYNPFVENNIMDAFTTEIGGEIYYHANNGFFLMGGMTNGMLNPSVKAVSAIDAKTGKVNKNAPALIGKIGFDKQINPDFRARLTASIYNVNSSSSNTLYSGDRTGSHYFLAMENVSANVTSNAWSGRFIPGFSQQVRSFMINPFFKYKGIEFFGTAEVAKGRTISETALRQNTQLAGDIIYRFPADKENFWLGVRYNTLKAAMAGVSNDVNINRTAGSFGWFLTKNIMLKAEYVGQSYNDFPTNDYRHGGKFHGAMLEASIGF